MLFSMSRPSRPSKIFIQMLGRLMDDRAPDLECFVSDPVLTVVLTRLQYFLKSTPMSGKQSDPPIFGKDVLVKEFENAKGKGEAGTAVMGDIGRLVAFRHMIPDEMGADVDALIKSVQGVTPTAPNPSSSKAEQKSADKAVAEAMKMFL
jgi:hypothetical protein